MNGYQSRVPFSFFADTPWSSFPKGYVVISKIRPLIAALFLVMQLLAAPAAALADEVLYNGIRLPAPWPPAGKIGAEPMAVPYLDTQPKIIPIDVGRQLFVDDFLVEKTDLTRTYHRAEYHPATPVLRPDQPSEMVTPQNPCAMVFSDGVWYDPKDRLFKMWYMAGIQTGTGYATSRDGIHWEKPLLDVVKDTNLVQRGARDSATIWLDHEETDPSKRFKLFLNSPSYAKRLPLAIFTAPDGIHWKKLAAPAWCGDRSTVFYNPFRKVWVFSIRTDLSGRTRSYYEHDRALEGATWKPAGNSWKEGEPTPWIGSDKLDPVRADLQTRCELYNLDAVAYESVMLGLFTIWRGQPLDRNKPNELCAGFSRDGFHWHRPDRQAFIPVSEKYGDWNWCNVQSAGGCCLVVGDRLYFYVSGRAGVKGTFQGGVSTTGLAVLRRDGFASMDAGASEGTLTTRPVRFQGKHLFVNLAAAAGELRAEVLDEQGEPIAPFTKANCLPVKGDKTLLGVTWRGADDLGSLAGKPVRFRFHLTNGQLYSFWVSPEKSGASHGYVAAGGPGFTGGTDTAGAAAYEAVPR
jgi:hypothetical protein